MKHIYKTFITNDQGSTGSVSTDTHYLFHTKPVKEASGAATNPEQLLGASWATCLNSTLHSVLKARQIEALSRIRVEVDLFFDDVTRYEFHIKAYVAIQGLSLEETKKYTDIADRYCPVSKLLKNNQNVSIVTEVY